MRSQLKKFIKNSVNQVLSTGGYQIARKAYCSTMENALDRIAQSNYSLATVIDVGASNGSWSSSCMHYLPTCRYLLIEAQPVHAEALKHFQASHRNAQFVLAAAGEACGQLYFDAADPVGGQASHTPYSANNIQVPVTTLDHEIQLRGLHGPYLIKLDTHGFEAPILQGATNILRETNVIIMECYNFKIAPECLLFFEMCEYLQRLGFRCIDLVDPMHRVYDDVFWQMDLVFVREDRPEFSYTNYR